MVPYRLTQMTLVFSSRLVAPCLAWLCFSAQVATAFVVPRQDLQRTVAGTHGVSHCRLMDAASDDDSTTHNNKLDETSSLTYHETLNNHMATSAWHAKTDDLWNQAWHDAFVRNDLVDFTPPLTDFLFCCMIGNDSDNSSLLPSPVAGRLPWENQREPSSSYADLSISPTVSEPQDVDNKSSSLSWITKQRQQEAEDDPVVAGIASKGMFRYDCIFDTSLMNTILKRDESGEDHVSSFDLGQENYASATVVDEGDNDETSSTLSFANDYPAKGERQQQHLQHLSMFQQFAEVQTLLQQATQALQEHGIFVTLTSQRPSAAVCEYLRQTGPSMGLQWHFDLDEINDSDEGMYVSVARKYFTGDLPPVGTLARPMPTDDHGHTSSFDRKDSSLAP